MPKKNIFSQTRPRFFRSLKDIGETRPVLAAQPQQDTAISPPPPVSIQRPQPVITAADIDSSDPRGANYYYRFSANFMPWPIASGASQLLISEQIADNSVLDITWIEFSLYTMLSVQLPPMQPPITRWTLAPDDYLLGLSLFYVLRDDAVPWNSEVQGPFAGGIIQSGGIDVLNRNILGLGGTPGHLPVYGGSTLKIETRLSSGTIPANIYDQYGAGAGVRIFGRIMQQDHFDDQFR